MKIEKLDVIEWFELANEEKDKYEARARYLISNHYYLGHMDYVELAQEMFRKEHASKL